MKGTIVNTIAVIAGGTVGMLIGRRFPQKIREAIIQGVGLFTLLLGVSMILKSEDIIIIFISLILGIITGEALKLEEHLLNLLERVKSRVSPNSPKFVEGFITATLVFCVGAMTIVGSIEEGLTGNATLLYTKSLMDGVTSITLASGLGVGVVLSSISVFLIQGGLTLLGSNLQFLMTPLYINVLTATGGLLIIAIGFELIGIKKLRILNMLPSLFYAPFIMFIKSLII